MRVVLDFDGSRSREQPGDGVREARKPVNPKARLLALAYHIDAMILADPDMDIAAVARAAGVSTARVSQLLDLTLLEPGVQQSILDGTSALGAHALRRLAGIRDWQEQKRTAAVKTRSP